MRAFLAIPVLPPALSAAQALHRRLVDEVPEVRWGPAASLHVTLHFFGAIGDADVARALDAVGPVFAARPPLRLHLEGLGSFPSAVDPRVLWIGVGGDVEALAALAMACRSALSSAGFATEDRRYRPHCTMGRPRGPWPARARRRWVELSEAGHATPDFIADVALIYRSVSTLEGVRHDRLATLAMGVDKCSRAAAEPPAGLVAGGGDAAGDAQEESRWATSSRSWNGTTATSPRRTSRKSGAS